MTYKRDQWGRIIALGARNTFAKFSTQMMQLYLNRSLEEKSATENRGNIFETIWWEPFA
jgi:hypothetical protein